VGDNEYYGCILSQNRSEHTQLWFQLTNSVTYTNIYLKDYNKIHRAGHLTKNNN